MLTHRRVALAVPLIALLTLTAVASAKSVPYVEPLDADWGGIDDPFVPPSGAFFANFFGRLDAGDVDAISMSFEAPVRDVHVELLVPECGALLRDVYPALAVVGPGLDAPDPDLLPGLPFELRGLMGVVVLVDGEAPDSVSPRTANVSLFDWMYYGEALDLQVDIPQAGDYVFVVWNPSGTVGAYALTAGSVHPGQVQFPDEETLREVSRLLETGGWIGLDCNAGPAAP